MCGRIVQTDSTKKLVELLEVQHGAENIADAEPSYNLAPGSRIIALQINEHGDKIWTMLSWGMQPEWMAAKRPVINARAETVQQKPLFRNAFQKRRSVIPVTAYYEWHPVKDGKQPYCIRRRDNLPLLLAGLHNGNECVIMTRSARWDIAFIHNRMPVILSSRDAHLYLGSTDKAHRLFLSENDGLELDVYPVTKRVGTPTFNHPVCLEPIDRE